LKRKKEIVSAPIILPRLDTATLAELRKLYEETPNVESRTRYQMLVGGAVSAGGLLMTQCSLSPRAVFIKLDLFLKEEEVDSHNGETNREHPEP
jgi:hypothetical protein